MAAIEVHNLKKYFGKTKAVDDITFSVDQGEIFGFLGPNGAGKTTAIRCMMDFLRPTDGAVTIFDMDSQQDSVAINAKIGFLSGYVRLNERWSGQDHIDFIRKLNGIKERPTALCERLNFNPDIRSKSLSSGNRQKLGIIMAMMKRPELLIMDEPTNGLDPLLQQEVYAMLGEAIERGATVFMSSHNLAEVERVCDRVAIIKQGKLVATESIASLKKKKINTVHAYFDEPVDKNEFKLDNIELEKSVDHTLILKAKGDINPLIKKLAEYRLNDLDISQASLEDIFLEYYEKEK